MNIHEHQAKEILKQFGINVPDGFVVFSLEEMFLQVTKRLNFSRDFSNTHIAFSNQPTNQIHFQMGVSTFYYEMWPWQA